MIARKHRIGAVAAVSGLLLGCVLAAMPAGAQGTPPPWAPNGVDQDPNALGGITFYDSSGTPITSGTTSAAPFASYAAGSVEPRAGDVKAVLYFYVPEVGQTPDTWASDAQVGLATTYPNANAPAPLNSTSLPVDSASSSDQSLDQLATNLPNSSTQTGYQNVYEIRMYTNAPHQSIAVGYDYADILINSTAHTWSLVYSPVSAPTATAPGPPTAVHGTPGNSSATVSWTAPASSGGAAIIGYHVQYSADGGGTWVDGPASSTTSTATSATVTGLTNGTAYEFRVAAINSVGTGDYSAASSPVTPAPPTAPDAPTGVHATAGNASATVVWTAPASNGGAAIAGYDLEYSADNGGTWTSVSPSFHTSTVTAGTVLGLTNGAAYEFRVAAINSVGTSAYSAASAPITPSATVADASKLTITAPSTIKYGTAASLSGTLTDARTSAAIAGQKVKLYGRRGAAAFAAISTVTTSSRGIVSVSVKPASTEQFEWVYSGAATHKAVTSAVRTVTVTQVVAVHVTAKHRKHGKRVKFYGTVSPNGKGQRVKLQILAKGKWKTVKTVVIHRQRMPNRRTRTGFVISYKLHRGATRFRLYKAARSTLAAGHSKTIRVRGT